MPLEEYLRKRDFQKTPEPRPGRAPSRKEKLSYLIQKHDATRLHYDFRLEWDGVLLSWAVTKGPSLNPADKRLAVRTEDHPLSYGSFEGTIPQGEYGGGTVMLWDTGSWEPLDDPHAGLRKGHLSFLLHGKRLKGRWNLVRMKTEGKRENWLLMKVNDEYSRDRPEGDVLEEATVSVKTGRSLEQIGGARKAKRAPSKTGIDDLLRQYPEVQLATLVDGPPAGDEWLHEIKFDGYRLLAFVANGSVRLLTRNGKDWTTSFPAIVEGLERLPAKDAVLDMEAVILDPKGVSSFQALQAALGAGGDRSRIVGCVFDLLYLDGEDLSAKPLTERKQRLRRLLKGSKHGSLRYSDHVLGAGAATFARACEAGLEGIISKQASAAYRGGRQRSWLKVKCARRQEFIIAGFSDARSGGRAIGALYLAYRDSGKLHYAGKVGTGFTMESARELAGRFAPLAVEDQTLSRAETAGVGAAEYRAIHWVKPVLVCEVAFTEWTQDGRIRHPSFQGLREDKDAKDVKREREKA